MSMRSAVLLIKAKEILSQLKFPATIDPVARDLAEANNLKILVEALQWAERWGSPE